ncbi:hypothetical protein LJB94_01600, partial [Odoribacter sp. OttesenSCG-928-G04]|nr:hypothetical protein [Odoribacter sp. OttesenSCG-928-G04]
TFPELDKVKTCLIVWKTHTDELRWQDKLKKELPQAKIDKVCIIQQDYQEERRNDIIYINSDDVDMKGKINNQQLNELLEKKYDLLIDLNSSTDVLSDFVVRNSHALCKVSMVKESDVTDIMIDGVTNENDLITQTIAILSKFKKC